MTFNIPTERIEAVLIGGHWHEVAADGEEGSFTLEAYVFRHGEQTRHLGGDGFRFRGTDGRTVAGPGDQIQAVRYRQD